MGPVPTGLFSATHCRAGGTCSPRGTPSARLKVPAGPRGSGGPGPRAVGRAQARAKPLKQGPQRASLPRGRGRHRPCAVPTPRWKNDCHLNMLWRTPPAGSEPPSCLGFVRGGFTRRGFRRVCRLRHGRALLPGLSVRSGAGPRPPRSSSEGPATPGEKPGPAFQGGPQDRTPRDAPFARPTRGCRGARGQAQPVGSAQGPARPAPRDPASRSPRLRRPCKAHTVPKPSRDTTLPRPARGRPSARWATACPHGPPPVPAGHPGLPPLPPRPLQSPCAEVALQPRGRARSLGGRHARSSRGPGAPSHPGRTPRLAFRFPLSRDSRALVALCEVPRLP